MNRQSPKRVKATEGPSAGRRARLHEIIFEAKTKAATSGRPYITNVGGAAPVTSSTPAGEVQTQERFVPLIDHHQHLLSPAGALSKLPAVRLPEDLGRLVSDRELNWNKSWSYAKPGEMAEIATRIRQIGLGRILYASDGPPAGAWDAFRQKVPLTDREFRAIANNVAPYMSGR